MKQFVILILVTFSSGIVLIGQNSDGIHRCSADEHHAELMQNAEYAAQYNSNKARTKKYIADNAVLGKMPPCANPWLIPVAVHYQGTGIDAACAEEMALDQVERMNLDFAGTNTDIGDWANAQASGFLNGINNKESCIQFCLASLNHPPGFGLNDGDFAITLDATTGDNDAAWMGYLNFWVRDVPEPTNPAVLGYSPLGGTLDGSGVTCRTSSFGSVSCGGNTVNPPFNLGRTITHEVGHYFSLNHPFGAGCVTDADGIADTPITSDPFYGCPNFGDDTCTDPVLWMSYMDYVDDACMYMFSEGQIDQMEAHVNANLLDEIAAGVTKCQEAACINYLAHAEYVDESCDGFDGEITMSVITGVAPFGYSIDGGVTYSANPTISNLTQATYEISIIDDAGCEHIETINMLRASAEMNLVTKENSFCGDSSGSILVDVNENTTFNYSIDGAIFQPNPFFENLNYGLYDIVAINNAGCTGILQIEIGDDNDLDVIIDERKNINCFYFDNGEIEFHVNGAVPPISYALDGSFVISAIPSFQGLSEGNHNVHIIDSRGCQEDLDFEIVRSLSTIDEECPCVVYVPNAMTPDEDSFNELFQIKPSCPITNYNIEIYDRWGHIVFQSNDIEKSWNGAEKNGDYYVIDGLYFYKIKYAWGNEFESTVDQVKVGNVLVLR